MNHRPKSDYEMQRAAERNFFVQRDDTTSPVNTDLDLGGSGDRQRQEAAQLFDEIFGDEDSSDDDDAGSTDDDPRKAIRLLVSEAAQKYGKDGPVYKANKSRVDAIGARSNAENRRLREFWKGEPLREYRTNVSHEQRRIEEAGYARDRYEKRIMETEGRTPRRYNERMDYSGMTPDQIAAHKRERARLRKQESRKRQGAEKNG